MTQLGEKTYSRPRISNSSMWLFLVMLTLPHTTPPYLNRFLAWDILLNSWRLVSFSVIMVWVLIIKAHISPIVVLIAVRELFLFFTTMLHKGEVYSSATSAFSVLSIVLLYDVAFDEGKTFLSSQLFCFEIVVYINLITIILFPNGLYSEGSRLFVHNDNWFLGYYNNHTKYYIPALMIAWLYKKEKGTRWRTYLLTVAVFLSAFLVWSGGVLVSLFAMAFVFVFLKNRTTIFNYFTYWSLHIGFFIVVLVLHLQDAFRWLIDGILGKWGSLTGRIFIWGQTISLISASPILGYGVQSQFKRAAEVHYNHGVHAHSMLFEILYQGGAVGMSLWILIVFVAGTRLYKYRNTAESKIMATAFLGWCIATLVEPFTTCFLMGMFVIAYHSNHALSGCERVPERKFVRRGIQ